MHDSYSVAMMEVALNEYVRSVRAWIAAGRSLPDALRKTAENEKAEAKVEIVTDQKESSSSLDYPENFSVYFRLLPYLFVAVMINVLCPILRSMNQTEQRQRIDCSSVSLTGRYSQIYAASAILVLFIWLVFMIAGMFVYGGIYRGTNCYLAVLNSLLLALIAAMFAIFVASFNPSATVVGMIAQVVGLGMSFLCGAFVPQSLLGDGVLTFAKILPAYWYERANDILAGARSGGMNEVWICFGVEAGFLVLLILLTLIKASRPSRKRHS
jgi:ABC-2 type transport system permease protein